MIKSLTTSMDYGMIALTSVNRKRDVKALSIAEKIESVNYLGHITNLLLLIVRVVVMASGNMENCVIVSRIVEDRF